MLCLMSPEGMVPERHPARRIKKMADECLAAMSSTFDAMYAGAGRPSIPPERLLKGTLLMALYSVRSERQFCEQLSYNLLFRWFLDMDMVEPTFDPTTFEAEHRSGDDVPAWLLDTAWNGLSFHVSQAFFPRTSAWDNLRKALKTEFEESVWDHLSGTVSAPFTEGDSREIAVKVIDDRGNELLVVKSLDEAE